MSNKSIAFIGGGNMAASLIGGLIGGGWPAERILVAEPDPARQQELIQLYRVHAGGDNPVAAAAADIIVLAVKPQVMRTVAVEIAPTVADRQPLLISIAAGVREPDIRRWLGYEAAIVRAMPNTPALVGSGAAGLFANPNVTREQRSEAESILRAVGLALWVENEGLMDAVTAVSGSGPAYFFLLMELMEEAGVELGLKRDSARLLALETAFGASKMALESPEEPATLRARVTSPGGTTERAVTHMLDAGLRRIVSEALGAARDRAVSLGEELGEG